MAVLYGSQRLVDLDSLGEESRTGMREVVAAQTDEIQ